MCHTILWYFGNDNPNHYRLRYIVLHGRYYCKVRFNKTKRKLELGMKRHKNRQYAPKQGTEHTNDQQTIFEAAQVHLLKSSTLKPNKKEPITEMR